MNELHVISGRENDAIQNGAVVFFLREELVFWGGRQVNSMTFLVSLHNWDMLLYLSSEKWGCFHRLSIISSSKSWLRNVSTDLLDLYKIGNKRRVHQSIWFLTCLLNDSIQIWSFLTFYQSSRSNDFFGNSNNHSSWRTPSCVKRILEHRPLPVEMTQLLSQKSLL